LNYEEIGRSLISLYENNGFLARVAGSNRIVLFRGNPQAKVLVDCACFKALKMPEV